MMCRCWLPVGMLLLLFFVSEVIESKSQTGRISIQKPLSGSGHALRHNHGVSRLKSVNSSAVRRRKRKKSSRRRKNQGDGNPINSTHGHDPNGNIKWGVNEKCSSNCKNNSFMKAYFRVEQIKREILKQTGLEAPPNMTGFVLSESPALQVLINSTNNQWNEVSADKDLFLYETINDDARQKSEKAFISAAEGLSYFKLPDGFKLIYFNLSKEKSSEIDEAILHIWVNPIEKPSPKTTESAVVKDPTPKLEKYFETIYSSSSSGFNFYEKMIREERKEENKRGRDTRNKKKRRNRTKEDNYGNESDREEREENKEVNHALPELIITILKINPTPVNQMARTAFIRNHSIPYDPHTGQWVDISLAKEVRSWLLDPAYNAGILIRAETKLGRQVVVTAQGEDAYYAPLMELNIIRNVKDRNKRFASNRICDDGKIDPVCCRYPLIVNFVDFHWDFIVAPKRYEANYCRGECPFLFAHKYPHSTLVQQSFNDSNSQVGPCCGARNLDPLRMVYFDGSKIKIATIRDMVVKQCGCT